jgi:hypothetical protein
MLTVKNLDCSLRDRHATYGAALRHLRRLVRRPTPRHRLGSEQAKRIYHCGDCGAYHVGTVLECERRAS